MRSFVDLCDQGSVCAVIEEVHKRVGEAPIVVVLKEGSGIDEDLLRCDELWAAAGTPRAVFCLASAELARLTGGRVVAVS